MFNVTKWIYHTFSHSTSLRSNLGNWEWSWYVIGSMCEFASSLSAFRFECSILSIHQITAKTYWPTGCPDHSICETLCYQKLLHHFMVQDRKMCCRLATLGTVLGFSQLLHWGRNLPSRHGNCLPLLYQETRKCFTKLRSRIPKCQLTTYQETFCLRKCLMVDTRTTRQSVSKLHWRKRHMHSNWVRVKDLVTRQPSSNSSPPC